MERRPPAPGAENREERHARRRARRRVAGERLLAEALRHLARRRAALRDLCRAVLRARARRDRRAGGRRRSWRIPPPLRRRGR